MGSTFELNQNQLNDFAQHKGYLKCNKTWKDFNWSQFWLQWSMVEIMTKQNYTI